MGPCLKLVDGLCGIRIREMEYGLRQYHPRIHLEESVSSVYHIMMKCVMFLVKRLKLMRI